MSDQVTLLADEVATTATFMAVDSVSGRLGDDVIDGLVGLSRATLQASNGVPGLVDALLSTTTALSFCMTRNTGLFVTGPPHASLYAGELSYTPLVRTSETFYRVQLSAVHVGGVNVPVPAGVQPIVDTGTTLLLVPSSVFYGVTNALRAVCRGSEPRLLCGSTNLLNLPSGYCLFLDLYELYSLPPIVLSFPPAAQVTIPATAYVFYIPESGGTRPYCGILGVAPAPAAISELILGIPFFQSAFVSLDRASNALGLAGLQPDQCVPHLYTPPPTPAPTAPPTPSTAPTLAPSPSPTLPVPSAAPTAAPTAPQAADYAGPAPSGGDNVVVIGAVSAAVTLALVAACAIAWHRRRAPAFAALHGSEDAELQPRVDAVGALSDEPAVAAVRAAAETATLADDEQLLSTAQP